MPIALQVREAAQWLADVIGLNAGLLVRRGVQILGVLLLAYAGFRLLKLLTHRIERAVDDGDPNTFTERAQRGRTLAQLLNSVGAVAIGLAAGLTILNLFLAIGPLLAGVGVAGLAVSFGAQSLVKDVIAGFFILLENQFGVGDVLEINGVGGVVERMTLRVVMLRDVQGTLHIIPNGSINLVSNLTRGWARAVVDMAVAYKENVDSVIHVMRDVAASLWDDPAWKPRLLEEPAVWGVERLSESAVDLRIVAATQAGKQWDVARELRRRLKNRFDAEGIEIPFPQRTLHLGGAEGILSLLGSRKDAAPAADR